MTIEDTRIWSESIMKESPTTSLENLFPFWRFGLSLLLLGAFVLLISTLYHRAPTLFTSFRSRWVNAGIRMDPFMNGVKYPLSFWTDRGGRRYQEDRFDARKNRTGTNTEVSLYAVYDGHGGPLAAEHCRQYLLPTLLKDESLESDPSVALARCYRRCHEEFVVLARKHGLTDGTTAVVAIVGNGRIVVGNAGDSRAIVVQRNGRWRALSVDHRPERKDEEMRIRSLGGNLVFWGRWRVEGVLAVSRAIGDFALQPYVTYEPEVLSKALEPEDEFLVLATDGLWDVMENEAVASFVLRSAKSDFLGIGRALCSEAIILGSPDNVTAVVVDLKRRPIHVD